MTILIVCGNRIMIINNKVPQFEVHPNNINSDHFSEFPSNYHINLKVFLVNNFIMNLGLNQN